MKRIKSALFDAGKSKSAPRRRRGQIYSYVKKFDLIINGYDPFYESVSPAEELHESDVSKNWNHRSLFVWFLYMMRKNNY